MEHRNSWNENWYNQLRIQACYVLSRLKFPNVEPDDLINYIWYRNIRYTDKNKDTLRYTARIRYMMQQYLFSKCLQSEPEFELQDYQYIHNDFKTLENRDSITAIFNHLNKEEITLLYLMFFKDLTQEEIGKKLNVSRECIGMRYKRLLKKIRKHESIYSTY